MRNVLHHLRALQCVFVEEFQSRYIHTLEPSRDLALLDKMEQECPYLLLTHLCGRALEVLGKLPDTSQIIPLGVHTETSQYKIVLHLFSQLSHRSSPFLKVF